MPLPSLMTRDPWLIAVSGFVLGLILSLALALFGFFSPVLTILALGFIVGGLGVALFSLYRSSDRTRLLVMGGLTILALLVALRAEPTIFTGRDQGSIAIAAIALAENHELAFRSPASDAFFNLYGPGRALNFPGFSYTDTGALITQFPLGYISYLGLFAQWFGLAGLLIGNALLLILAGWTMFELLSRFVSERNAFLGTLLFSTSFLSLWLAQMTLTENLALFLFLALALALVRTEREDHGRFLPLILLIGFLFALTRIEGFIIAPIAIAYIILRPKLRAHLLALPKIWAIPALLALGFLFLRDFFMNLPFYTMIGKAALKYWHEVNSSVGDESNPNLGPILFSYGLFPIFIFGIASLAFETMRRNTRLLIPVLLAAPTFVYLLNGHISDDHPWLLRRYAFTLFPLFLLATVVLWDSLEARLAPKWRGIIFSLLLIAQFWPSLQAIRVIEYQTLRTQALNFATPFDDRDLILIDRNSSGDPFALLAGPIAHLAGKQAVYFFNPEDYARLDRSAFDRVYLLTTEDTLGRYGVAFGDQLLPVSVTSFTYPTLTASEPYRWPMEKIISSDAILFEVTQ